MDDPGVVNQKRLCQGEDYTNNGGGSGWRINTSDWGWENLMKKQIVCIRLDFIL